MIITIAGPPCSGKSTLARALAERLGPTCCVAPDVFAAFVARLGRAPSFEETSALWNEQVKLNYRLCSLIGTVLCAGSPWATCAYARARGTRLHLTEDAHRLQHYCCAIMLQPLPWASAPGRVDEPNVDRVAMADDMARSLSVSGLPHILIQTVDPQERLTEALEWLRSFGASPS